jgi:hypothetical protein
VHTLECMLPQVCALLIERDSSEQTNTHNDGYMSAEYVADNIRFRNAEIFDYMETMLVDTLTYMSTSDTTAGLNKHKIVN